MTIRYIPLVAVLLAACPVPPRAQAETPPDEPAAAPAALVSEQHHGRKFYTFARPAYAAEPGAGQPGKTPAGQPADRDSVCSLFPTAPPADWTAVGFDDSAWLVRPGREFYHGIRDNKLAAEIGPDATNAYLRGSDPFLPQVALVCQRCTFNVPDRGKLGKVILSLVYRGGFVAYLNGREIARGHLPAGKIEPFTPADVYPPEAFFYRNTLAAPRPRPLDPKDSRCNQWPLRERSTGPIDVPPDALRDGTNVLAIELHRGLYPAVCAKLDLPCATVGLSQLRLVADAKPATPPPPAPPAEAWTVDITRTVFDPAWSAMSERSCPLRIVAARNGQFSAHLIVAATGSKPIGEVSAKVSMLRRVGGAAVIAPEHCRIRFAQPNPLWKSLDQMGLPAVPTAWRRDAGLAGGKRFDLLLDAQPAPAEQAVSIWLTVAVPRQAAAGRYEGTLRIDGPASGRIDVPVHLLVAEWALPDVKDYATLINLYQSPETLAAYYKVKPWSEDHWRLIGRSMQLLGQMGNIGIFIPLLAESQMGNPESMVVWVRQADGSYTYDFSIFDRYLDTAVNRHDRLRFVSLNVWGYEASLRLWRTVRDYATFYGARVTVQDSTGKRESFKLPQYGTPECEKLWRPLLLATVERLKAKGLADKVLLGLAADMGPDQATAAMFQRILPGAGWIAESHVLNPGYIYDSATKAAMPVRYNSIVYGADIPDPAAKRLFGWQHKPGQLVMNFNRSGSNVLLFGYPPPWSFHIWMESSIACGRNGNGRVGGDYWRFGAEILGQGERGWGVVGGSGGSMFGRYMHSHCDESGLGRSCTDLLGPGPDGAVETVRLVNAREGIQETEARAFLEKALTDKSRPMPADLARRCQQLLDERTNVLRLYKLGGAAVAPQGWQDRNAQLFDAAAEVAALRAE